MATTYTFRLSAPAPFAVWILSVTTVHGTKETVHSFPGLRARLSVLKMQGASRGDNR